MYTRDYYAGSFFPLLTGSRHCASQQQVHRSLRDAYKFYQLINMPIGR
jgi:hypothetical protein